MDWQHILKLTVYLVSRSTALRHKLYFPKSTSFVVYRHASFMLPYKRGKLKQYAEEAWMSTSNGFKQKQCSEVTAVVMGRHSR